MRALALTASARPLERVEDAGFEALRILDNFNIPVGATAAAHKIARDITSATQLTTTSDLKHRVLYFHTMDNRQIQKLDLGKNRFCHGKTPAPQAGRRPPAGGAGALAAALTGHSPRVQARVPAINSSAAGKNAVAGRA